MVKANKAPAKKPTPKREGVEKAERKRKTPLSPATLKKFKDILLSQKERMMKDVMNLRETHLKSSQRESAGDLSGYSLHMADIGTDTYDREFGLAVATSEGDILYLIDHALQQIGEKTYGLCETCGKTIKLERLKAVPWARLCIGCQEEEEKGGEVS